MTTSDLTRRIIIIHGLVEKIIKDCEVICVECNNEPDLFKKEILKTRICGLGNRLHKYRLDLDKLKGKLTQQV